MSKNKKQHYVSVFYLYNFTSKKQQEVASEKRKSDTNIWHHNRESKQTKEKSIKNLATEPYHLSLKNVDGTYDHSLDNELRKLEEKTQKAIDKLQKIISNTISIEKNSTVIENSILDSILEFSLWQAKRHPDIKKEINDKCINGAEENMLDLDTDAATLYILNSIGRDKNMQPEALNILKKKNAKVLFTTNDTANFITTDKPFVLFNPLGPFGINHDKTEVYFPLSSNILLMLYGKGERRSFELSNDRQKLRTLNIYLAKQAKKYIFGNSKDYINKISKYI